MPSGGSPSMPERRNQSNEPTCSSIRTVPSSSTLRMKPPATPSRGLASNARSSSLHRSGLRVGVVVDEEDEVVGGVLRADVAPGGAEVAGLEHDRAAGAGHLRGAVAGGVDDDHLVGAALGFELVEHARGHLAAVEGEQHGADGHGRAGYPRR